MKFFTVAQSVVIVASMLQIVVAAPAAVSAPKATHTPKVEVDSVNAFIWS
ncbi:hypothetical protein BDQ17DRAFT_1434391 [Cyathus striatus]|nr:hypothetical protein BDQ17DRAFT_1434391 [Cyathus striatus]